MSFRHLATVGKTWDISSAVLIGDYLKPLSFLKAGAISEVPDDVIGRYENRRIWERWRPPIFGRIDRRDAVAFQSDPRALNRAHYLKLPLNGNGLFSHFLHCLECEKCERQSYHNPTYLSAGFGFYPYFRLRNNRLRIVAGKARSERPHAMAWIRPVYGQRSGLRLRPVSSGQNHRYVLIPGEAHQWHPARV